VHGLAAPGEYRAVVRFRWYAADGSVRNARRTTRSCRQRDPRPDLVAGRLEVAPSATPGLVAYRLTVRNAGRTPAEAFAIALELDGVEAARATVAGLAGGASTTVAILGPTCAGGHEVQLRLDADDAVAEADEDDGLLRPACPLRR
jgi:subtilase family serine protease